MSKTDTEKYLDKLEMEIFRAAKREIKLHAELKRLRGGIQAYLDLEIETHELKELIE